MSAVGTALSCSPGSRGTMTLDAMTLESMTLHPMTLDSMIFDSVTLDSWFSFCHNTILSIIGKLEFILKEKSAELT